MRISETRTFKLLLNSYMNKFVNVVFALEILIFSETENKNGTKQPFCVFRKKHMEKREI